MLNFYGTKQVDAYFKQLRKEQENMVVTEERLGDRDIRYSKVHRQWDRSFHCMDIDFIEYDDNCNPVGVLELKHCNLNLKDYLYNKVKNDPTTATDMKQFKITAKLLGCPAFIVVYKFIGEQGQILGVEDPLSTPIHDMSFVVVPANKKAIDLFNNKIKTMNEEQYVEFLRSLRK